MKPRRRRRRHPPELFRMTHRQIARELGISHARVQQIERAALEKLRRALGAELEP